jgi:hypothetical protein
MVCTALDNGGFFLNQVDLVITGPEGPYAGTINQDSLIFTNVPYGAYSGTSTWQMIQVQSDTVIGETNHHLVFQYTVSGTGEKTRKNELQVSPNPVRDQGYIQISLADASTVSLELADVSGHSILLFQDWKMEAGNHQFNIRDLLPSSQMKGGIYLLRMKSEGWIRTFKFIVLL